MTLLCKVCNNAISFGVHVCMKLIPTTFYLTLWLLLVTNMVVKYHRGIREPDAGNDLWHGKLGNRPAI